MKHATKAAKKKTEARLKQEEARTKKLTKQLAHAEHLKATLKKSYEKEQAVFTAQNKQIDSAYVRKMASLAKSNTERMNKYTAAKAKGMKDFFEREKSNSAKAEWVKLNLKRSDKLQHKREAAAKSRAKRKADKEKSVKIQADRKEKKAKSLHAKSLAAKRGKERDSKEAKAKKADAVLAAVKKVEERRTKKAKAAESNSKAASEKSGKAEARQSEKEMKKDAAIKSCDPGQCEDKAHKCHNVDDEKGPYYFAGDMVSCTKKKPMHTGAFPWETPNAFKLPLPKVSADFAFNWGD